MSQFHHLYNKVLSDSDFRVLLVSDPTTALESLDITPTPELLAALNTVIAAVTTVEADLDDGGIEQVPPTAFVS